MGRYQWSIFFLCGAGYFLDLAWAQAFGMVAAAVQQELGVSGTSPCQSADQLAKLMSDANIGNLSVAFNTGLTIGAFTWGLLVDILGVCRHTSSKLSVDVAGKQRRWCFNVTCLFASVFGFLFPGEFSAHNLEVLLKQGRSIIKLHCDMSMYRDDVGQRGSPILGGQLITSGQPSGFGIG